MALRSLLWVSRQIRHEVQEVLQERMGRQVIFNATCWTHDNEVEAVSRAHSIVRGNVPSARQVWVLMMKKSGAVTWVKNNVGWGF